MNKKHNAKHSSNQVSKKFGASNFDTEFAAETAGASGAAGAGAANKASNGKTQKPQ